jgi:hypothetical protein
MRRLKQTMFQLLIGFALCIVATLSFADSTKDVIVVNPGNHPVPVTGSITASGTVTVGGTVQTQDVDNRTRHAWQKFFSGSNNTFMVPAGQRLTIEFTSFSCTRASSTPVFPKFNSSVNTSVENVSTQHILPATYDGTGGGLDFYSGAFLVRVYADPDTEVSVFTGIGGSACGVTLSGYMTQMP